MEVLQKISEENEALFDINTLRDICTKAMKDEEDEEEETIRMRRKKKIVRRRKTTYMRKRIRT